MRMLMSLVTRMTWRFGCSLEIIERRGGVRGETDRKARETRYARQVLQHVKRHRAAQNGIDRVTRYDDADRVPIRTGLGDMIDTDHGARARLSRIWC